ncbi:MAG: 50S ribosomal protein L3 [Candidatus Moraniibacteriota bacterium]
MKFILAKKIGMTTIFKEDGTARNVTLLEAGENVVTRVKTEDKDGYSAVQVGFKGKNFEKGKSYEKVREFKTIDNSLNVNDIVKVDQFEEDEKVVITGVTKAKGFQGVVKRWSFAGSPASHGHRHDLRAPGSIGGMYPQKVFKGKKMAGRMGGNQKTVKNLKVALVDKEKGLLAIEGAVPGNNKSVVEIYTQ